MSEQMCCVVIMQCQQQVQPHIKVKTPQARHLVTPDIISSGNGVPEVSGGFGGNKLVCLLDILYNNKLVNEMQHEMRQCFDHTSLSPKHPPPPHTPIPDPRYSTVLPEQIFHHLKYVHEQGLQTLYS